jgi:hypothetical protein
VPKEAGSLHTVSMSEMGLGCVKTPRRLSAIEDNIRQDDRALKLAGDFNLDDELKNVIPALLRSFTFLHSQSQNRKCLIRRGMPVLSPIL